MRTSSAPVLFLTGQDAPFITGQFLATDGGLTHHLERTVDEDVAAVLERVGEPLQRRQLELQGPGPGEVLVAVRAAGLCHSDLSVIDGSRPRPLPMALGNEIAAEVVAVGRDVRSVRPGDHVHAVFVAACGSCVVCHEGRTAMCAQGAAAKTRGTLLSGERRLHTQHVHPVNHHLGRLGLRRPRRAVRALSRPDRRGRPVAHRRPVRLCGVDRRRRRRERGAGAAGTERRDLRPGRRRPGYRRVPISPAADRSRPASGAGDARLLHVATVLRDRLPFVRADGTDREHWPVKRSS